GNRISVSVAGGGGVSYSYDRADRILSTNESPSGPFVSYTVNAAGNMVGRGSDVFTYDQADRLTSSTVGGVATTYAYNGDGVRRSKTTGTATTTYVFDVNRGLETLLDDGTRKYVWGLGPA